jgi:hypothetical protein
VCILLTGVSRFIAKRFHSGATGWRTQLQRSFSFMEGHSRGVIFPKGSVTSGINFANRRSTLGRVLEYKDSPLMKRVFTREMRFLIAFLVSGTSDQLQRFSARLSVLPRRIYLYLECAGKELSQSGFSGYI